MTLAAMIMAACLTSAFIAWALCALYWSGRYSMGLVDGRAEALESYLAREARRTARPAAGFEATRARLAISNATNVVDMAAWRAWADTPDAPIPNAPTQVMGRVVPLPQIERGELDQWVDQVIRDISERIYGK